LSLDEFLESIICK